jgi:TctA family transporter
MIENFLAGSAALFGDPFTIGIFVFGVIGGMLFGAIPGVSMLTLAAILLPFTAGLEPAQGVMLFAVILAPPKSLRLSSLVLWLPPLWGRAPFGKGGYRS